MFREVLRKITESADIPSDVALGDPKLTVIKTGKLHIEGHNGIVEYSDERIVINCKTYLTEIKGSGLSIDVMDSFELAVSGIITGIEFIYREAK